MNSENMMNLFNDSSSLNNTFDFSKNWDNSFNDEDDDEIIISSSKKNDDSDFIFDSSFKYSTIISVFPLSTLPTL